MFCLILVSCVLPCCFLRWWYMYLKGKDPSSSPILVPKSGLYMGWAGVGLVWGVVVSETTCWIHANLVASADWKYTLSPLYKSLENIILTNDFVNTPGNWLLLHFQQQLEPVWLQVLENWFVIYFICLLFPDWAGILDCSPLNKLPNPNQK